MPLAYGCGGVIQFVWLGTSWPVGMIAAGWGPLGRGSVCVGARHPRYDMLEVYSMVWSSWVWLSCVAQKVIVLHNSVGVRRLHKLVYSYNLR